ncbi:hypothetical protein GJ744_002906 [Endocarpon pusillum]|uniref:Uncharacterized protein n=1 Tax=Endocarpon pusillum TaxID=364733 RepID=A0A8H7DZP9_9EURO|nr:hypothetical protein GJ744_002906 [Endocarpon pusillum]
MCIEVLQLYCDHSDPRLPTGSGIDTISLLGYMSDTKSPADLVIGLLLIPTENQRGRYIRLEQFSLYVDNDTSEDQYLNVDSLMLAFKHSRVTKSSYLECHDDNTNAIEII